MTPTHADPVSGPALSQRHFPVLLLLFVGSGGAALIYEVVWFQLLQLVIGSSAVSLAVLLGTFMGGMCLGSLLLPKFISPRHHPLRVYALIELGIAVSALAVLFGMPLADRIYVSAVGYGMPSVVLRAVVCAICLLPPTLLMGATLPAIARWVETNPRGVAWLGFFYGGNIAGAVVGCLLAGFYLLRVYDLATATAFAVVLNLAVGMVAYLLSRVTPYDGQQVEARTPASAEAASGAGAVYVVIALSGLCALGAQVVWARLLSLLMGGTVYTFSIILAVFLVGLGIGSSVGAMLARNVATPRAALGWCQLMVAGGLAWAAWMIGESLPYWPVDHALVRSPWHLFPLDLMRSFWAVFPATILWGASFPLALSAVVVRGEDAGKLVGRVYAANTLGAIAGAVLISMVFIPAFGTQQTQRLLMVISITAGLVALLPAARTVRSPGAPYPGRSLAIVVVTAMLTAMAWKFVPKVHEGLVTYGRRMLARQYLNEVIYLGEGMNASVAVSQSGGWRYFHVSGKVEASTDPADMRLQRMLGHMPAMIHPRPRSVLIVGCGAGVTAGSFIVHPDVERIVLCEIEPLIPRVVAEYFGKENYDLLKDPRVEVVYDDARHYILTTKEKFDVITSDPIHPWVKGAAVLYTQEYFELCRERLNPGGIISQWVPLYESTPEVVKSEVATFFDVFPHGSIWSNDIDGEGYDTVMIGHAEPISIDAAAMEERLMRPDHQRVRESMREVGFDSAYALLRTYAGRKPDLTEWLVGAEINRERSLRLMYLAGLGSNTQKAPDIYNDMVRYRRFPQELFAATPPGGRATLEDLITRPTSYNY